MTYPVSTVPAVKTWLYAQLQTACTADAGVDLLVRYGDPGPYDPEDVVSVGDIRQRRVEPFGMVGTMQAGSLNEAYTLTVEVDVMRAGDDPAGAATTKAWALASQVETAVRTDPTLGSNVILSRPSTSSDTGQWSDDHNDYAVHVEVDIYAETVI